MALRVHCGECTTRQTFILDFVIAEGPARDPKESVLRNLNKLTGKRMERSPAKETEKLTEAYRKEIVQRITKSLLDLQLLRMLQAQPLWGYRIKKQVEADLSIKLRHGALYPTLNQLEKRGFVVSQRQQQDGRARRVYTITAEGEKYLQSYVHIIREHTTE